MIISLENFLRNQLQELEQNHEYSIGTDSVRALIDQYKELHEPKKPRPFLNGEKVYWDPAEVTAIVISEPPYSGTYPVCIEVEDGRKPTFTEDGRRHTWGQVELKHIY